MEGRMETVFTPLPSQSVVLHFITSVEACQVLSFPGIRLTPYQGCVKIGGATGSSQSKTCLGKSHINRTYALKYLNGIPSPAES